MSTPYQFPPDLQQWVDAHLSTGVYRTPDDLLRDAMHALDDLDREKLRIFQEGNRIAMEQSRPGRSKPLDLTAVLDRVEQCAAAEGKG